MGRKDGEGGACKGVVRRPARLPQEGSRVAAGSPSSSRTVTDLHLQGRQEVCTCMNNLEGYTCPG